MTVYVDILLFVNTIINYAILMTAERLLKRNIRLYRILLGAFTGSLFSLLIFFDANSRFFLFLLRILSSALITMIAFGFHSKAEYIKAVLCSVLTSVGYCGFFILFYQIFKPPDMIIVNDVVYLQNDPLRLVLLTAVIYVVLLIVNKLFSERIKSTVVTLQFTIRQNTYSCVGKIDTGCHLREPFSSAPVIIADSSVFAIDINQPFRVIPYSSLGGSSILNGVKADSVIIDQRTIEKDIYIASGDIGNPNYQAIINSDIIR
ncbi:MAG: sigma-E processing peptidase SpoIIGA [Ruminococcus sp.]|uniref:sigma-E processing peptidase SpoIIGA n=1 Tax=Ruminococcus sp. TaxID=41978 RepID=UPI002873AC9B|nr:sigma-E processing peptidase SpoIIGA [Ruminococcus sp.]MBQ3284032.1 sigma-E processing peptidase SpoIIGA [Ruminococcus sp.]